MHNQEVTPAADAGDIVLKAQKLHDVMQRIRQKKVSVLRDCIELGRLWKVIRDEKLWEGLEYITSFREFCERETGVSHTTVYAFIKVSETFGDIIESEPTLIEIDHTRLIKMLPIIEANPDEPKVEWLHKALTNSKKDFANNIRVARGKMPTDKCMHPADEQELWYRCKVCLGWHPVKELPVKESVAA